MYILYYICLCFVLIYMIHSIYNHFKNQFGNKNVHIVQQLTKESAVTNDNYVNTNNVDNMNTEEMNKMKSYFNSLK